MQSGCTVNDWIVSLGRGRGRTLFLNETYNALSLKAGSEEKAAVAGAAKHKDKQEGKDEEVRYPQIRL